MIEQYKNITIGINRESIVSLICDIHGPYEIKAWYHYTHGYGCQLCTKRKPKGYWTLERCIEEAKKFNSSKEWEKKSVSSYQIARINDWLDECTKHFINNRNFTFEKCLIVAKKYKTKKRLELRSPKCFKIIVDNGWLEECCAHMISSNQSWTLEKCIEDALKYNTRTEWSKNSNGGYRAALKNKWINKCVKHMKIFVKKTIEKQFVETNKINQIELIKFNALLNILLKKKNEMV